MCKELSQSRDKAARHKKPSEPSLVKDRSKRPKRFAEERSFEDVARSKWLMGEFGGSSVVVVVEVVDVNAVGRKNSEEVDLEVAIK